MFLFLLGYHIKTIHGDEPGAIEETHQSRVFVRSVARHIFEPANVVAWTLVDVVDECAKLTETRSEGIVSTETLNYEDGEYGAEIQKRQNTNHSQWYKNQRESDA